MVIFPAPSGFRSGARLARRPAAAPARARRLAALLAPLLAVLFGLAPGAATSGSASAADSASASALAAAQASASDSAPTPAAPGGSLPPGGPPRICDGASPVTLIGMDTASGLMLFTVPAVAPGGPAWLIELDGAGREARAWPDRREGRFSGSIGPGPVLAAEPCGRDCLQPVRWEAHAWHPVGEPLTVPAATTLASTYDAAGGAWFVAHGAGGRDGLFKAWAFHLEGRNWKARGGYDVTAVGQPQVLPAPQRRDGVVSGTGLFSASGPPSAWVAGLPDLPLNRRGQLLAISGSTAAYVSADGVVYLSDDQGKSWRRSTWTPWGGDTTGMWRQGTEYGVDLPLSDHRGALQLAWYDRRNPADEKILLTRLAPGGSWAKLAEAPTAVRTKSGESLPVSQILVPQATAWILLSGCAATAGGSGFVLRSYDGAEITAPRFVPFVFDELKAGSH
jgi:hypothetical protein